MNKVPFLLFVIFSAFTMNLVLHCALGIKGAAESRNPNKITILIKLGIIFTAVILLWVVFSRVISMINTGIFIYVLLFPVSFILYNALEFFVFSYVLKREMENDNSISFPGGITAVAAFICINIANGFIETAALSFGFVAGIFLVLVISVEIRRRAALESVPFFLRGKPLVLVSMGMLALIFSTASLLLFRMIGAR
jgi:electron transport complex protein RnfA